MEVGRSLEAVLSGSLHCSLDATKEISPDEGADTTNCGGDVVGRAARYVSGHAEMPVAGDEGEDTGRLGGWSGRFSVSMASLDAFSRMSLRSASVRPGIRSLTSRRRTSVGKPFCCCFHVRGLVGLG